MTTREPGASARLHPRLGREPELDGLLGDEAGADHHLRVRGVRTARDGGDDDVAVVETELVAVGEAHGRRRSGDLVRLARSGRRLGFRERAAEGLENIAFDPAQRHAVLRA